MDICRQKKERAYVVVATARGRRLIVGQAVLREREWEQMQRVVDTLPAAKRYCTDDLAVYSEVLWHALPDGRTERNHIISEGKRETYTRETYTIEGINADLRTYLGQLKRRSRCFSRCIGALRRAIRLFVWYYNKRQRAIIANPKLKGILPLVF